MITVVLLYNFIEKLSHSLVYLPFPKNNVILSSFKNRSISYLNAL